MNETDLKPLQSWLLGLQDRIVEALAREDGGTFSEDCWQRSEGGGGRSCVLEDGTVIEKGGINFSEVSGISLPASASAHRPELAGRSWRAMGVSLVIHPRNPYVPTAHMNVRFFVAEHPEAAPVWWFGGGFDLTPYYGFDEDCQHWHRVARDALAAFPGELYAQWKEGCDRYFYLKHRQEQRGIGGLFFDDFNTGGWAHCLAVWQAVGEAFLPAYLPILQKRRYLPYGDRERNFQLYRRGRYVEFNLVYDRGTLFGLQSGGRTEAILMSLPREVHWRYQWQPEPDSREEKLTSYYLQPRSWI